MLSWKEKTSVKTSYRYFLQYSTCMYVYLIFTNNLISTYRSAWCAALIPVSRKCMRSIRTASNRDSTQSYRWGLIHCQIQAIFYPQKMYNQNSIILQNSKVFVSHSRTTLWASVKTSPAHHRKEWAPCSTTLARTSVIWRQSVLNLTTGPRLFVKTGSGLMTQNSTCWLAVVVAGLGARPMCFS